jgi:predicted ABC-type sugar transport system permease subunit
MIGALAIVLASEFDGVVISAVPVVDFVGTYVGFCCFNGVRFLFMDGTVLPYGVASETMNAIQSR